MSDSEEGEEHDAHSHTARSPLLRGKGKQFSLNNVEDQQQLQYQQSLQYQQYDQQQYQQQQQSLQYQQQPLQPPTTYEIPSTIPIPIPVSSPITNANTANIPTFLTLSPTKGKEQHVKRYLITVLVVALIGILLVGGGVVLKLFAPNVSFGHVQLYYYLFVISGLILSYGLAMLLVRLVMKFGARMSRRFRHYVAPFTFPIYTCIWALLCLLLVPALVPETLYTTPPAKFFHDVITIIASCSLIYAGGKILIIVIERLVYGGLQGRMWNALWCEKCIAAVALDNSHATQRDLWKFHPTNILKFYSLVQEGKYGLAWWLDLDNHNEQELPPVISLMIMQRDRDMKGYVTLKDISTAPNIRPKDAATIFKMFDPLSTGRAEEEDVKRGITAIFVERKAVIELLTARRLIVDVVYQD